jgi:serine/threonine protein phosphatase PrpC
MGCASSQPAEQPAEQHYNPPPHPPPHGAPIGGPIRSSDDYNNNTVSTSTIRGQEKLTLSRGASVMFRKEKGKAGLPDFGDLTPSVADVTPVDTPSTNSTQIKQLSSTCLLHYACVSLTGHGASTSSTVTSKANQDSWTISSEWSPSSGFVAGVFDGHGPNGEHVAQYVSKNIISNLLSTKTPDSLGPNFEAAFTATQNGLEAARSFDINLSGTTAVTIYISKDEINEIGEEGSVRFFCANVGDSRALLLSSDTATTSSSPSSSLVTLLSSDHKPDRLDEQTRVLANAKVKALEILSEKELGIGNPHSTTNKRYMCRMNQHRGTIKYGIMFTRSLGDGDAHEYIGVTHEPEIKTSIWEFGKHSAIILASDGVWDALTNDEAASIVLKALKDDNTLNCQLAATALVQGAKSVWDEDATGRRDDITDMIIVLEKKKTSSTSETRSVMNVGAGTGKNTLSVPLVDEEPTSTIDASESLVDRKVSSLSSNKNSNEPPAIQVDDVVTTVGKDVDNDKDVTLSGGKEVQEGEEPRT